jgi:hypothetical protein
MDCTPPLPSALPNATCITAVRTLAPMLDLTSLVDDVLVQSASKKTRPGQGTYVTTNITGTSS